MTFDIDIDSSLITFTPILILLLETFLDVNRSFHRIHNV